MLTESLSDYGTVALALGLAGTATRMTELMRLAATRHDSVRITERDRDGHRVVELGGQERPTTAGNKEAA
ncbi:hypothetical protein [Paractinoplanes lichenicola]|nr:hypothetical protein [Actinoplanes lichenicola]